MVVFFLALIVFGFLFPKSKFVTVIQLILCGIVFSFNTDNPDYTGYLGTYQSIRVRGVYYEYFRRYDPLYKLIVYTCNYLNMSFNAFRVVIFLVCSLLILSTVKKITEKTGFVISMYMIFPFVMDCIQIRNFIGASIVVYSFRFLQVEEDEIIKKKNAIRFGITIIIASMFHYVSIVYLIYLISFFKGKTFELAYKVGFVGSCVVTLFFQFYSGRGNTSYLGTNVSMITFIFLSGITFIIAYNIYKYTKRTEKYDIYYAAAHSEIFKILKISSVFIPILIFHFDMFRFIRNMLVIFSCYSGAYFSTIRNRMGTIILSKTLMFCVFVVSYGLLLWRSAYYPYDISLVDQILNSIKIEW